MYIPNSNSFDVASIQNHIRIDGKMCWLVDFNMCRSSALLDRSAFVSQSMKFNLGCI
jgi:hypothetical protein